MTILSEGRTSGEHPSSKERIGKKFTHLGYEALFNVLNNKITYEEATETLQKLRYMWISQSPRS